MIYTQFNQKFVEEEKEEDPSENKKLRELLDKCFVVILEARNRIGMLENSIEWMKPNQKDCTKLLVEIREAIDEGEVKK